jgi:hypothetical protein
VTTDTRFAKHFCILFSWFYFFISFAMKQSPSVCSSVAGQRFHRYVTRSTLLPVPKHSRRMFFWIEEKKNILNGHTPRGIRILMDQNTKHRATARSTRLCYLEVDA